MCNRKRKEGETKMLTGARCTASEQSWQTALVSLVLFFFSSSWLKKNLRVPAELGDECAGAAAALSTPPPPPAFAESSWQWGRPAPFSQIYLRRSAANISPHLSERLFLSHSLPLSCWHLPDHFLPLPPLPIFCFSVWPSRRAHNLPVSSGCFSPREEGMSKGSSLGIQDHYGLLWGFFCHSCRVWGKSEN